MCTHLQFDFIPIYIQSLYEKIYSNRCNVIVTAVISVFERHCDLPLSDLKEGGTRKVKNKEEYEKNE